MEAIGKLAGGVAHDFNNMLTVINGYSYMLLRQVPSDAPLFRDLNEIRVAGERAASLTRQLLAFSRKQVLRPDLLDLCAVVSNMDGLLRRLIGEDVEFEVQLGTRPCLVRVDRGQIEQVIMNLAVNARDAMPDGGRLKISTESVQIPPDSIPAGFTGVPGRYALLSVEDGGAGIEESIRNRIFDPFFTTKPQGKGTGLGLSTVYGIVAQSGGCITVESQPGEGSQFRVYLPIVVDDWARAVESEVSRPEPTAGVGTLILVEDDKMVRKMTASILQEAGYTVLEAGDGSEALELARQHEGGIDLVITDMVLPGMNGREVAKRLLRSRPDLKVLYVSGYAEPTVSEKDGMNRDIQFIRKPFLPDVLAAKVRELLGRA
jgi:CheY-like chemotaxis protein